MTYVMPLCSSVQHSLPLSDGGGGGGGNIIHTKLSLVRPLLGMVAMATDMSDCLLSMTY